jgi:hypothetical protein
LRQLEQGTLPEQVAAAEQLAQLPLPADETPILVHYVKQPYPDTVRVPLLRALERCLQAPAPEPEITQARAVGVPVLLGLLYTDGPVQTEALAVAQRLAAVDARLQAVLLLVRGNTLTTAALYAVPQGADLNDLVLAATRSKPAKERLQAQSQAGAIDLDTHPLVARLRALTNPQQSATVADAQALFNQLEGLSFGSVEANRNVAALIRALCDRLGVRLCCPKCGKGARLALRPIKSSQAGIFQFDHGRQDSPHAGNATIPRLEIIPSN